jgi:hypothetical protein
VLNLNRANLSLEPINTAINSALERIAAPATERLREQYPGASQKPAARGSRPH